MDPATDRAADPFGRLVGTLVAAAFGTVFVLANSDAVPSPWGPLLRVLAVVVAVALALGAVWTFRSAARRGAVPAGRVPWGRGYRLVVAGEVVALVLGLVVVNTFGDPAFAVTWVAFVVGVHFVVLGRLWRFGPFLRLGAVMTTLAVLAAVVGLATGSVLAVQLLAGVGSGVALFAFGAAAVDRPARR